jgi:hypothetical protein
MSTFDADSDIRRPPPPPRKSKSRSKYTEHSPTRGGYDDDDTDLSLGFSTNVTIGNDDDYSEEGGEEEESVEGVPLSEREWLKRAGYDPDETIQESEPSFDEDPYHSGEEERTARHRSLDDSTTEELATLERLMQDRERERDTLGGVSVPVPAATFTIPYMEAEIHAENVPVKHQTTSGYTIGGATYHEDDLRRLFGNLQLRCTFQNTTDNTLITADGKQNIINRGSEATVVFSFKDLCFRVNWDAYYTTTFNTRVKIRGVEGKKERQVPIILNMVLAKRNLQFSLTEYHKRTKLGENVPAEIEVRATKITSVIVDRF